MSTRSQQALPAVTRVLILGGGFGAVYAALRLDRTLARRPEIEVTLVSRDNFLLFSPMLHEVAAGDLNPGDIVNPIRRLLKHVTFIQGEADSIDLAAKRVSGTRSFGRRPLELAYDHLVIALGSETNFFGQQGLAENALTLKSLGDATLLRARVLEILEIASAEPDPEVRKRLLTFVAAGGGFAGVETIGAVNDLAREALRYYPRLTPDEIRVVLVHPGKVVLPELGESLGRYAQQELALRGVEIRTEMKITDFDGSLVSLTSGEAIPSSTLIWTAGVAPTTVITALPCEKEKGRIVVDPTLEVPEFPGVWAVGDCAAVPDAATGKPQPPTAQHAIRQAEHAAENIEAVLAGLPKRPFRFSTIGQLASIGHRRGVASVFGVHVSGWLAWCLWRTVYLAKLPGLQKKLRVAFDWALQLIFPRDIEQMVTLRDMEALARVRTQLQKPPSDARPLEAGTARQRAAG